MYFDAVKEQCRNVKLLNYPVDEHDCCSYWDAPGTIHIGRQ